MHPIDTPVFVIVKEVLANGHLTKDDGDGRYVDARRSVALEAERLGTTPDAIAIAAALAQPWANVVLSGAATVKQIESNLAARRLELREDLLVRLRKLAVSPNDYWSYRATGAWT